MWEKWELKNNPYSQNPIDERSLNLFVGRKKEIALCYNCLSTSNSRIVIEGGRGVGTTSLANYVRYTLSKKGGYLTPDIEISVGRNWNLELLLSNVLAAVVYALERRNRKLTSNRKFQNIKKTTQVIEERFKAAGFQAFGFGGQFGESAVVSYPRLIPVVTLTQYMNELSNISKCSDNSKGIIIHLDNLDIKTVFEPDSLRNFLNEARDSFQIEGYHWMLIGDTGLRGFIGSHIDRLDDIITAEVKLKPLTLKKVQQLIDKRIRYYSLVRKKVSPPIDFEVIKYLYSLTDGRLRYIFGICTRLLSLISSEALIHTVDLDFAKPIIMRLAEERIAQRNISPLSLRILRMLVESGGSTTTELAKKLDKGQTSVSRCLRELLTKRLVKFKKVGKEHIYSPSLDAKVAYG